MKKLLALLIACTAIICTFASCGDKEKESSVSGESSVSEESVEEETTEKTTHEYIDADATAFLGKWECEKIIVDGEELADFMGIPIYAMFQFDIKDDGKAYTSDYAPSGVIEYKWGMISETEIEIVSEDGTALTFSFEGDKLASRDAESGNVIYLVSVDELTPFDAEEFMNESASENAESTEDTEKTEENAVSEESETTTVDE